MSSALLTSAKALGMWCFKIHFYYINIYEILSAHTDM